MKQVDCEASPRGTVGAFARIHTIFAAGDYTSGTTLYLSGGLGVGFGQVTR